MFIENAATEMLCIDWETEYETPEMTEENVFGDDGVNSDEIGDFDQLKSQSYNNYSSNFWI